MTPKTRRVLDYLDKVLAKRDQTAREVALVVSALRGPDNQGDDKLKMRTTAHIRTAAFPKTAAANADAPYIWVFAEAGGRIALTDIQLADHFRSHVGYAAQILRILEGA